MRRLFLATAFASFAGVAVAGDIVVTFTATVDRAVVPPNERLVDDSVIGAEVAGRIVFAQDEASRDIEPAAGRARTFWQTCIREISVSGAVDASFFGGTMFLQDGQLSLNASKQYCVNCSRSGAAVETTGGSDGAGTYHPFRYLFVQTAPHVALEATFADTIKKMVGFSSEYPLKALLLYTKPGAELTQAEPGSGTDAVKYVLTLGDLTLIDE